MHKIAWPYIDINSLNVKYNLKFVLYIFLILYIYNINALFHSSMWYDLYTLIFTFIYGYQSNNLAFLQVRKLGIYTGSSVYLRLSFIYIGICMHTYDPIYPYMGRNSVCI